MSTKCLVINAAGGCVADLHKLPLSHYKESVNCKTLFALTKASGQSVRTYACMHKYSHTTKHAPLHGLSVVVSLVDHEPGPQGSQLRPHVYSVYVYSAAFNRND